MLEGFLRRLGHEVVACGDGEAGLAAYKAKYFPVVLCDIVMPRMTGIDFLQAIAEVPRRENSSVLLMTAHANIESAIAALKLGAYDYLAKPINLSELIAILERITAKMLIDEELARSKDQLIVSEARFRGIFDHIMGSFSLRKVILGDTGEPVDLEFIQVNPAFEQRFGLKAAEVIGKRVAEVFPRILEDDGEWLRMLFEVALTGRPISRERYIQTSEKFYQVSAYSPEPGLVAVIANDISENKRYESLVAEMADGFAYCKMVYEAGKPEDLVYLAVNDAFTELTGLKDVIGKRITEVIPGIKKSNPELLEIYGRVARTGRSERFEGYYEPLKVWLSVAVSSRGDGHFMAIFDNITKRKHMEEALRESELKYRMLFDNVNDAIFLLENDHQGKPHFSAVNDIACHQLGYSRAELLGFSVQDIHDASTRDADNRFISRLRTEGVATYETTHRTKDGTLIPVELNARYFSRADRSYYIVIARDLTERKRADKMLRTSYERIRRDHLLNEVLKTESLSERKIYETLVAAGLKLAGSLTCYLLVMQDWKGKPIEYWKRHLEELHYLQDSVIDMLSSDECWVVWNCAEGIGMIHSGAIGGADAKQFQQALAAQVKQKVEGNFSELKVVIGISESTSNVADLRIRHRQSCIAVNTGRKVWPERKIYHYLDMGIFQVLPSILAQEETAAYIERNLGNLIRYDADKKMELLATLEAILENNLLKEAAAKLFVHLKTIDFRKKRIEKILGVSLDHVETRMTLALAVRLLKLG